MDVWVHLVQKRNESCQLCIDMCTANQAIARKRYQVPTVDELMFELNGSKYFIKTNFQSASSQVELRKEFHEFTYIPKFVIISESL